MKENNDKMGYEKDAKALGVKRDFKLKFAAMGMWWLCCTFIGMIVLGMFSSQSYLMRLMITVPVGFVMMLVIYYLVLPNVNNEHKFYSRIVQRFNNEGMSRALAAEIDEHLRISDLSAPSKRGYYNGYLNFLVMYNLNTFEYDEALRLLDITDRSHLNEMYGFTSGRGQMVNYYYLRMLTLAQKGDIRLMEYNFGDASKVFSECRGINMLYDAMIDSALAMRAIAFAKDMLRNGDSEGAAAKLAEAEQMIQYAGSRRELRQDYCSIMGRCAALKGDRQAAAEFFDEAHSLARNDFQRECELRVKQMFLGN